MAVAVMRIYQYASIALLIFFLCIGLCFISIPALAQSHAGSPDQANVTYVSLYSPVAAGEIKGIVLDEGGNPVPNAVVTLWQDGHIWMEGKRLSGCTNPQRTWAYYDSGIYYQRSDGEFSFVFVNQGSFVVTAEKEGYNASAIVYVTSDPSNSTFNSAISPPVKMTLDGYHMPAFSPEQLSYTGAVAGTLRNGMGVRLGSVNVSLSQDGQMVVMPGNPQLPRLQNVSGREVDYLFEHLAPGQYQVVAEYWWGGLYNESVMVNISNRMEIADIPLSHFYAHPMLGTPSPTPLQAVVPSPGTVMTLLSIGSVIVLIHIQRFRHKP